MRTVESVRVTEKGQITIPKRYREIIGSDIVRFDVRDGVVAILPVKDVGGALREYGGKRVPLEKARARAWGEAGKNAKRR